jgi:threonine/homoserine/homoserine lactone efflux protein
MVFAQGVLTSTLNPKIALFFLAFLPQFVDPAKGSPASQLVTLGLLFVCSGTAVNVLVALGVTRATAWLGSRGEGLARKSRLALRRITGAMFIALAVRVALVTR